MEYKIIWSEAALGDLKDIYEYIAEHTRSRQRKSAEESSNMWVFWKLFLS
jgi:plasmid stabilization system protein ParE